MSRFHRIGFLSLALLLASCSKSATTAPGGVDSDARGTPLSGENAFETGTRLSWSPLTNEVLGSAKGGGTLGGPGLAAVRTIDGAARILDPAPALFPLVDPDGRHVYYDAVAVDSTFLRRRSLGASGVTSVAAVSGLGACTFAISPDGRYLAYAAADVDLAGPDSLHVLDQSSGRRVTFAPGWPIAFSFDDGTLLVTPPGGGWAAVALSSGATTPVDFALPGGAGIGGIRWDSFGLHALFAYQAHELWISTILGAQARVVTVPETIVASSITWSPDGTRAAFWTVGPIDNGADTAYRLYVVSIAAHAAGVVAIGRSVGGAIAWSPDGARLGYLYGDRLFSVSVVAAGAAATAR